MRDSRIRFLFLLLPALLTAPLDADQLTPALGYGDLDYAVPKVGSYRLPPLGKALDGMVLDREGKEVSLYSLFDQKYVLLTFMYSRCDDLNGCPLSTYVFYQIMAHMQRDPELAQNLKLISLSFDPQYDTPEVLKQYANNFSYMDKRDAWSFISTRSETSLKPILQAYDQDLQQQTALRGDETRYAHILRVFLIDPERRIRNIYSVAFLHAELLVNDVKTLMLEQSKGPSAQEVSFSITSPGDDKSGYQSEDYQTNTRAIGQRKGREADLLALAKNPPLGLPPVPEPAGNRLTQEKIALGRKLFFDRRLSLNDTFSCAMCHVPEQGFTSNELETAVGIEGRSVRRNTQTVFNTAYAEILFHDGREFTLENQVWGPLLAKNEMGNPSVGHVLRKVAGLDDYKGLFEAAFDGKTATMETLGQALASYQRTLLSADSPFDRWYYGAEAGTMNASQIRGFELFTGRAGCSSCHSVGPEHALFTDNLLHNTGIGYRESMGIRAATERVQLAPGVFVDMSTDVIDSVGEPTPADVGQYEVTENPADRWKYKTPSLRNIALTAPYMHNGSMPDLAEVVEFYNEGGVDNLLKDARVRALELSSGDKQDLVNFMKSLTGSNVEQLVSDAFTAPIGDFGSEHRLNQ